MSDSANFSRFLHAQEPIMDQVQAELAAGKKRSHWMWFIFPQLAGLGRSPMAHEFALADLEMARQYLAHPVLGIRLRQCVFLVNEIQGKSASDIFGTPDDLKFRSSMTLFSLADPDEALFHEALSKYYASRPDRRTLELLSMAWPEQRSAAREKAKDHF